MQKASSRSLYHVYYRIEANEVVCVLGRCLFLRRRPVGDLDWLFQLQPEDHRW